MWVEFLTCFDADLTPHLPRLESVFTFSLLNVDSCSTAPQFVEERRPLINPQVPGQTSPHYTDTGLGFGSFQQITTMTDDHKQECICISGSQHSSLIRNVKACPGWKILRTPKTNPLPGPTGIHARVEIRERIYKHLAVVQWGQWTDRVQGEIPAPL